MTVLSVSLPVAIGAALLLLFILLRRGTREFVLAAQAVGTLSAQTSYVVTLSIGRLLPIVLAPLGLRRQRSGLAPWAPFVGYVCVATAIGAWTWEIPAGVTFMYGQGRVYVSLFNFLMLVLVARAVALALIDRESVRTLWTYFCYIVMLHGLASLYQLVAVRVGLPVIGISRPFGLTAHAGTGDVAAFVTTAGDVITRPGGLAGEPKTAAIVFGMYIVCYLFGARELASTKRARLVGMATLGLAILGFLAAFSTSAIFGLGASLLLCLLVLGARRTRLTMVYAVLLGAVAFGVWIHWTQASTGNFDAILMERTTRRVVDTPMDAPVQASLHAIKSNPWILIFGTGLGGSSFLTMKWLGESFSYSYAPNIGIVLSMVEVGCIGTILLLSPFALALLKLAHRVRHQAASAEASTLVALAISSLLLYLTGSGLPLSMPLAVGAIAGARRLVFTKQPTALQDT